MRTSNETILGGAGLDLRMFTGLDLTAALALAALCCTASARGVGEYLKVEYPASTATNELQVAVAQAVWIPDDPTDFRGVIVHPQGAGTTASKEGSTAAYDLHWQAMARKWECALMGPSYHVLNEKQARSVVSVNSARLESEPADALPGEGVAAQRLPPVPRDSPYGFDGPISRPVLERFLARSISVEGVFNGRGNLDDNIRMLKSTGVKYAGRSLCLWGAEHNFLADIERARRQVPKALAVDPELVLEACVFETVSPRVEQIAIPDWVFTDLGQPVEKRNFIYTNIIYPVGQRRAMGRAQVPDESRLETQLWFYYQAASYIDLGFEAIHFGQVEIMNKNDHDNAQWDHLIGLVRAYAAKHARRHWVLCNGHTPSGGLVHDGKLLLDFHAFPLRIKENPDQAQDAILEVGFSDGIYGHSKGGIAPSGWKCEHLPYLVELDNWGVSRTPGQARAGGNWVWGYDEISWFAHQTKEYRATWLQYAWDWVRKTDPNGFLQMPGSRTVSSPDIHWYFANRTGPDVPNGFWDEEAIRAVWTADAGKSQNRR